MALIVMAVHDTEENGRTKYTRETLMSIMQTVNINKHRIVVVDNNSCMATKDFISTGVPFWYNKSHILITNTENLGTAKAINQGLALREAGEYCIKIDNDVIIRQNGWVHEMQQAMCRDPTIGILGLKRKDLEQRPGHENSWFRSELVMLPHQKGERWIVVEKADDIMGTCTMYSPQLMDKIGGLYQADKYGWDDVDYSVRSKLAGFTNAFLPHIEIEHIDTGGDAYCDWKQKHAGDCGEAMQRVWAGYKDGTIPLYRDIKQSND